MQHAPPIPNPIRSGAVGEAWSAAVLDVLPDPAIVCGADGVPLRWNGAAAALCPTLPSGFALRAVGTGPDPLAAALAGQSVRDGAAIVEGPCQSQVLTSAAPLPGGGALLSLRPRPGALALDPTAGEERLSLALEAAGLGAWDGDADTGAFVWSAAMWDIFGLDPAEQTPGFALWRSRLHPEDVPMLEAAHAAARAADGHYRAEYRIIRADTGAVRWLSSHGRFLRNAEGRIVRFLGVLSDITDRRAAEAALRASEQRVRLAERTGRMGLWDWDVASGDVVWSEGYHSVWGLGRDVPPSYGNYLAAIHPEDRAAVDADARAAIAGRQPHDARFRVPQADSSIRWIAMRGEMLHDSDGNPRRMIGICYDATAEFEAQQAMQRLNATLEARVAARTAELAAEQGRLAAILEQLPVGVIGAAPDGRFVFRNPEAERLVGGRLALGAGVAGYDGFGAMHPDGRPYTAEEYPVSRVLRGEPPISREPHLYRRADGGLLHLEISAAPLRDPSGALVLVVVTLQDVTARLLAEEALRRAQRLEAVGQLTGGVAHDFNNLLTAIIGSLELLGSRVADPRGQALLENASRAAARGARLTGQLLAFSRKQRLETRPLDLNAVVAGMDGLLRSTLGATIEIDIRPAPDPWPALADPTQLELLILNLAINARDAMPEGGRLTIATGRARTGPPERPEAPPAGDYATLTVTDTGLGMTEEVLARVFEPFFTTKEVGKGSGLGLPQVLGVAQQLGGGVRIRSAPGAGTEVQVFLPRADRAPAPAEPARTERHSPLAGTEILLVEDDADVRAATANLLQAFGCHVWEAASGEAALAALAARRFDLVLMDYAMPSMNGAETARRAGLEPDGATPVLFLTGYADPSGLPPGTAGRPLLGKPFSADQLAAAVAGALAAASGPAQSGSSACRTAASSDTPS